MANNPSVSPIATIKPRRVVATVPCPRPGCGGKVTLTVGDKGSAWGTCKAETDHVGKTGRKNVCGAAVTLTVPQTRALLEGKGAVPPPPIKEQPKVKPMAKTIEVDDDEAEEIEAFRAKRKSDKAGGAGNGRKPAAGNVAGAVPGDGKPAARKRIGFFEFD